MSSTSPKPSKIRRIGRFIVVGAGLKALLFAAAWFVATHAQQTATTALL